MKKQQGIRLPRVPGGSLSAPLLLPSARVRAESPQPLVPGSLTPSRLPQPSAQRMELWRGGISGKHASSTAGLQLFFFPAFSAAACSFGKAAPN